MSPLDQTVEQLARTPPTLSVWLDGLPTELWHVTEGPGTWSPFEVLCHLNHAEDDDWIPRIRIILQQNGPRRFVTFQRGGGIAKYGGESPSQLLGRFADARRASLATLADLHLDPAALTRTATHPELGEVTLAQLLACWVTHDLAHIAQIARVLVRHHGASIGPWRAFFSLLR